MTVTSNKSRNDKEPVLLESLMAHLYWLYYPFYVIKETIKTQTATTMSQNEILKNTYK